MTDLELRIKETSQLYYSGQSTISDDEWDALLDELRAENPDSELLQQVGWGYDVENTPGEKYPHKYGTVGSLEKARTWKECKIGQRIVLVDISAKLDGLTAVSYYKEGQLILALTRGSGTIGIDITEKIRRLIGSSIADKTFTGAVKGEILMTNDNWVKFKSLHANDKNPPKNPRNSSAGLMSADDITDDFQYLSYVVYQVVGYEGDLPDMSFRIGSTIIDWVTMFLEDQFKYTCPREHVTICEDSFLTVFTQLRDKWAEIFPLDGLVITMMNDTDAFDSRVGNEIKYDAFAFKFPAEAKETTVTKVEWNMSKTRYSIPLVYVEPVELSGTTVQKATGFNMKYIKDNQIGPGAIVKITKSGEIIPYILEVMQPSSNMNIPYACPDCGEFFVENGVHLQCANINCIGAFEQDLIIWLEFLAPIDSFGTTLKLKFLEKVFKRIPTIKEVMSADYTGFRIQDKGSIQWNLFCDMLDKLTTQPVQLVDAIRALNIPRLGDKTADKFAEHPDLVRACIAHANFNDGTLDGNLGETYSSLSYKLKTYVGDANSKSILDNLTKFARLSYIVDRIVWEQPTQQVGSKGKVAITGTLSVKRSVLEAELKAAGFEPGDMKKDTKYLITDDPNGTSSKNKNARSWGVEQISESEFRGRFL